MNLQTKNSLGSNFGKSYQPEILLFLARWLCLLLGVVSIPNALASDNVPMRPFAMWADVPLAGQFIIGGVYEESEAYHIWAHGQYHNVTFHANGESYGNDINRVFYRCSMGLRSVGPLI